MLTAHGSKTLHDDFVVVLRRYLEAAVKAAVSS